MNIIQLFKMAQNTIKILNKKFLPLCLSFAMLLNISAQSFAQKTPIIKVPSKQNILPNDNTFVKNKFTANQQNTLTVVQQKNAAATKKTQDEFNKKQAEELKTSNQLKAAYKYNEFDKTGYLAAGQWAGKRKDGGNKGTGFFGEIVLQGGAHRGKVITEASIVLKSNAKDIEVPLLNPYLQPVERENLRYGKLTNNAIKSAQAWLNQRLIEGRSPFAQGKELAEKQNWAYNDLTNTLQQSYDIIKRQQLKNAVAIDIKNGKNNPYFFGKEHDEWEKAASEVRKEQEKEQRVNAVMASNNLLSKKDAIKQVQLTDEEYAKNQTKIEREVRDNIRKKINDAQRLEAFRTAQYNQKIFNQMKTAPKYLKEYYRSQLIMPDFNRGNKNIGVGDAVAYGLISKEEVEKVYQATTIKYIGAKVDEKFSKYIAEESDHNTDNQGVVGSMGTRFNYFWTYVANNSIIGKASLMLTSGVEGVVTWQDPSKLYQKHYQQNQDYLNYYNMGTQWSGLDQVALTAGTLSSDYGVFKAIGLASGAALPRLTATSSALAKVVLPSVQTGIVLGAYDGINTIGDGMGYKDLSKFTGTDWGRVAYNTMRGFASGVVVGQYSNLMGVDLSTGSKLIAEPISVQAQRAITNVGVGMGEGLVFSVAGAGYDQVNSMWLPAAGSAKYIGGNAHAFREMTPTGLIKDMVKFYIGVKLPGTIVHSGETANNFRANPKAVINDWQADAAPKEEPTKNPSGFEVQNVTALKGLEAGNDVKVSDKILPANTQGATGEGTADKTAADALPYSADNDLSKASFDLQVKRILNGMPYSVSNSGVLNGFIIPLPRAVREWASGQTKTFTPAAAKQAKEALSAAYSQAAEEYLKQNPNAKEEVMDGRAVKQEKFKKLILKYAAENIKAQKNIKNLDKSNILRSLEAKFGPQSYVLDNFGLQATEYQLFLEKIKGMPNNQAKMNTLQEAMDGLTKLIKDIDAFTNSQGIRSNLDVNPSLLLMRYLIERQNTQAALDIIAEQNRKEAQIKAATYKAATDQSFNKTSNDTPYPTNGPVESGVKAVNEYMNQLSALAEEMKAVDASSDADKAKSYGEINRKIKAIDQKATFGPNAKHLGSPYYAKVSGLLRESYLKSQGKEYVVVAAEPLQAEITAANVEEPIVVKQEKQEEKALLKKDKDSHEDLNRFNKRLDDLGIDEDFIDHLVEMENFKEITLLKQRLLVISRDFSAFLVKNKDQYISEAAVEEFEDRIEVARENLNLSYRYADEDVDYTKKKYVPIDKVKEVSSIKNMDFDTDLSIEGIKALKNIARFDGVASPGQKPWWLFVSESKYNDLSSGERLLGSFLAEVGKPEMVPLAIIKGMQKGGFATSTKASEIRSLFNEELKNSSTQEAYVANVLASQYGSYDFAGRAKLTRNVIDSYDFEKVQEWADNISQRFDIYNTIADPMAKDILFREITYKVKDLLKNQAIRKGNPDLYAQLEAIERTSKAALKPMAFFYKVTPAAPNSNDALATDFALEMIKAMSSNFVKTPKFEFLLERAQDRLADTYTNSSSFLNLKTDIAQYQAIFGPQQILKDIKAFVEEHGAWPSSSSANYKEKFLASRANQVLSSKPTKADQQSAYELLGIKAQYAVKKEPVVPTLPKPQDIKEQEVVKEQELVKNQEVVKKQQDNDAKYTSYIKTFEKLTAANAAKPEGQKEYLGLVPDINGDLSAWLLAVSNIKYLYHHVPRPTRFLIYGEMYQKLQDNKDNGVNQLDAKQQQILADINAGIKEFYLSADFYSLSETDQVRAELGAAYVLLKRHGHPIPSGLMAIADKEQIKWVEKKEASGFLRREMENAAKYTTQDEGNIITNYVKTIAKIPTQEANALMFSKFSRLVKESLSGVETSIQILKTLAPFVKPYYDKEEPILDDNKIGFYRALGLEKKTLEGYAVLERYVRDGGELPTSSYNYSFSAYKELKANQQRTAMEEALLGEVNSYITPTWSRRNHVYEAVSKLDFKDPDTVKMLNGEWPTLSLSARAYLVSKYNETLPVQERISIGILPKVDKNNPGAWVDGVFAMEYSAVSFFEKEALGIIDSEIKVKLEQMDKSLLSPEQRKKAEEIYKRVKDARITPYENENSYDEINKTAWIYLTTGYRPDWLTKIKEQLISNGRTLRVFGLSENSVRVALADFTEKNNRTPSIESQDINERALALRLKDIGGIEQILPSAQQEKAVVIGPSVIDSKAQTVTGKNAKPINPVAQDVTKHIPVPQAMQNTAPAQSVLGVDNPIQQYLEDNTKITGTPKIPVSEHKAEPTVNQQPKPAENENIISKAMGKLRGFFKK